QGRIPLFVGLVARGDAPSEPGDVAERQLRNFFEELRSALPFTPIVVLSRLSNVVEQWGASIAIAAGCESVCLLPDTGFASLNAPLREGFNRLRAQSTVLELQPTTPANPPGESAIDAAGSYIATHATIFLAIVEGASAGHGASSLSPLVDLRRVAWRGDRDSTTFVLDTSGEASPLGAAAPLSSRAAIDGCGWARADKFNQLAASALAARPMELPLVPFRDVPDERIREVAAIQALAGRLAADAKSTLRGRQLLLQSIGCLAAVSFAAALKFGVQRYLLWLYLSCLAGAVAVRKLARRADVHSRYLEYRSLGEALRVLVYWRIAGVHMEATPVLADAHAAAPEDPSCRWVAFAIRALEGWMAGAHLPESFGGCEFAARHWLGAEQGGDPRAQIPYYRGAARRVRTVASRVDRIVNLTLAAGVVTAGALAFLPSGWLGPSVPVLIAVMGFLPLISGVMSSALDIPAEQELARQYEWMASVLTAAARRFEIALSEQQRRQVLLDAGRAALAEHRVWHAVYRQKGPESHLRG
ncbi:MAG: hypothetical protein JOZ03_08625, partial [Gammaproteobacteria bacterium]|nr:hypothetical protein [Gammaproteobacteria bacterium]